mmetsp:Transcript_8297/g.15355  ORF Transcript_8297/g.15355 Transcript_8297/m.15355 type:complete len:518 (+) Transcript_8297:365-1918(+)
MRIAVYTMDAIGHLNPLLALCSKLMERGHFLRFFLSSDKNEKNLEKLPFKGKFDMVRVYEDGGELSHEAFMSDIKPYEDQTESDKKVSDIIVGMLVQSSKQMPTFLEKIKEFDCDLIIYDPFFVNAAAAAYLLNIPCVSTITFPGFNVYPIFFGKHTEEERSVALEEYKQSSTVSKVRDWYFENYTFDIFSNVIPSAHYFSSGLNICTGIKEFDLEMPQAVSEVYGGVDEQCLYVGPMLLTKEQGRVSSQIVVGAKERTLLDAPFPLEELKKYKRKGKKKVIYVSFGTVATGLFWDMEAAPSKMLGAKTSGKEFCRTMWKRVFEAFGGNDKYVVVMATVTEDPDALKGFEIPANFIVRRRCPQLDVLKVADVFITHGGANSMMESISAHVPMLVLPWFSDQPDNARTVSKEKVGLHYLDPVADCSAQFLARDVERLLADRDTFVSNCKRLQKSLKEAGGAEKASKCIEDYVASFKGHQPELSKKRSLSELNSDVLQKCRTSSFKEVDLSERSMDNAV